VQDVKKLLDADSQFKFLVDNLYPLYKNIPFTDKKSIDFRYYFCNSWFSYADGIFLYCILRYFCPKKIIEIGCGFTSALMLDVNELYFENKINITFIDINSMRFNSLIKPSDNVKFMKSKVQKVDIELFKSLGKSDLLFIDSSHTYADGSDVKFLLNEVLPILNSGVIIHFHDIFCDFKYPQSASAVWNEIQHVKYFLENNLNFKVLALNNFLCKEHQRWFQENMPICLKNTGGSLYIIKE
jgi:predicted O-methyltransferase YrrM